MATLNRGHGWHFAAGFTSREERAASYRFRLLIEPTGLLEPGFALPPGFARRMQREHRRFLEKPWRDDDAVAFFEINAEFHFGLAETSGNRFIAVAVPGWLRHTSQSVSGHRGERVQRRPQGLGHELEEVQVARGAEHVGAVATLLAAHLDEAAGLEPLQHRVE